jgi:very-short-patch-repair endonuclease
VAYVHATTGELVARGLSPSTLSRAVADGRLVRVERGLYAAPGDEVPLLARAARHGVLSHTTAARMHGFDLLDQPGLHVLAEHRRRSVPSGVVVHRGRLNVDDVVEVDGLATTSPMRTVVDCLRRLGRPAAVVLADSALRLGLGEGELRAAAGTATGPGARRLRDHVHASDGRSESALETRLRLALHAGGLDPELQAVVHDGRGFVARVDFLFRDERLVVEADGFAFHSGRAAYRDDRRRGNALLRAGYRVASRGRTCGWRRRPSSRPSANCSRADGGNGTQ